MLANATYLSTQAVQASAGYRNANGSHLTEEHHSDVEGIKESTANHVCHPGRRSLSGTQREPGTVGHFYQQMQVQ